MKIACLLLASAFAFACNGTESTTQATPGGDSATKADSPKVQSFRDTATLAGTWYLLPVLASDTGAGRLPQLNFNLADKTFSGNSGCNSMSGTFEYSDTSLVFNERIMLTKMFCQGYNEQAFIKNLLRTNHYEFRDSILILKFEETELSQWARTPSKPPVSNKL